MTPLFVRALKGESVERFPVWMMRQAGRYLPGYRAVRAKTPFLDLCRNPTLAAQVSLEPIERFEMDAAIVFADILLTADAMGVRVEFPEGGPRFPEPVRTPEDVARVHDPEVERTAAVAETVRLIRSALGPEKAVIGFSAAPFTLCAYMIEGGTSRDFWQARAFAQKHPAAFRDLMFRVADALIPYLKSQADAGADVLQLFDTWGAMADARLYEEVVLPATQRVIEGLGTDRPPMIFFAGIGSGGRLERAAGLGVEGLSLDWSTKLADAYARVGDTVRLQGNLDPTVLLSDPETIRTTLHGILDQVPAGKGHLVNLGHGVLRQTPPDHVAAFVDAAKNYALKSPTA